MYITAALAIAYMDRRMLEWGIEEYHLRFRHLRLQPSEQRIVLAYGHLFLLVDPPADIRVASDVGVYDPGDAGAAELQYEHQGMIHIANNATTANQLLFIQVIPKLNSDAR